MGESKGQDVPADRVDPVTDPSLHTVELVPELLDADVVLWQSDLSHADPDPAGRNNHLDGYLSRCRRECNRVHVLY